MNAVCQELALRSMTLRGIGSYFYGQRLDLRPLTVICGENGSGKSTCVVAEPSRDAAQRLRGTLPETGVVGLWGRVREACDGLVSGVQQTLRTPVRVDLDQQPDAGLVR